MLTTTGSAFAALPPAERADALAVAAGTPLSVTRETANEAGSSEADIIDVEYE